VKKRILAVFLASLLMLTLFGCRKGTPVRLPEADYWITFAEEYVKKDGNSLKLMYPEISGYADAQVQSEINRLAAEFALEMYAKMGLMANKDDGYSYTAMEAVTLLSTREFYSVYISGTVESNGGGDPAFFAYTVNADLRNAVLLRTEDIVSDYAGIRKEFLNGTFTPDFGTEEPEQNFTRQSLIEQYKHEYGIYPFVFFREGQFGLILETLPSLGGCAGYQSDIRDVRSYLNTENPVIAMLCGLE